MYFLSLFATFSPNIVKISVFFASAIPLVLTQMNFWVDFAILQCCERKLQLKHFEENGEDGNSSK